MARGRALARAVAVGAEAAAAAGRKMVAPVKVKAAGGKKKTDGPGAKPSQPSQPATSRRAVVVPVSDKLLLSVEEFAGVIGVCRDTAWKLVSRGDVRSVKIGRLRKVPREAVEEWRQTLLIA